MIFRCILIPSESGCGLDGSKKMSFRRILISSEPGCGLRESTLLSFRSILIASGWACGSGGNVKWSIGRTRRRRGIRRICSMGGICCICSVWSMCSIRNIRNICNIWSMCAYAALPRSPRADRFRGANSADCLSDSLQDNRKC